MHSVTGKIQQAIESATAGADVAALEFHPEGKWSITQILDHLSTSYAGTAKVLGRCLEEGKPAAADATLRQRIAALVVIHGGYFPSGRKAPEFVQPKGTRGEAIMAEILENLVAMERQIVACEERFGRSAKLGAHFIFGPLTGEEWRKFHLRHARHHMKQVGALRQKLAQSEGR
jgi:hypothetical protein